MDKELIILIPAFNEDKTIFSVVKHASQYGDVIVLDDASIDNTKILAEKAGANVIRSSKNIGYENILTLGFKHIIKKCNYKYLITLDADGEHNPDDIKKFLHALNNGIDIVSGQRSKKNRISEHVWAIFGKLLYKLNDPLCGMKGYNLTFINKHIEKYDLDVLGQIIGTYLTKISINNNCKIINIKINVFKRQGVSKFGSGLKINLRLLCELIKFLKG